VDGNYITGIDGSNGFGFTSENGLRYIEIDLGAEYDLNAIRIWHWYLDGRTYNGTKTVLYNAARTIK
jgi:hypothetical protein